MTERPGHVVDYGAFQHPTSPLFRDYLNGQAKALGFYGGGGWDLPALLAASERALTLERPRDGGSGGPRPTTGGTGGVSGRGASGAAR